jgi:hypothetical protein
MKDEERGIGIGVRPENGGERVSSSLRRGTIYKPRPKKQKRYPKVPFATHGPKTLGHQAFLAAFLTASTVCVVAAEKLA